MKIDYLERCEEGRILLLPSREREGEGEAVKVKTKPAIDKVYDSSSQRFPLSSLCSSAFSALIYKASHCDLWVVSSQGFLGFQETPIRYIAISIATENFRFSRKIKTEIVCCSDDEHHQNFSEWRSF